jgi:ubiquinone/menaquinone biosynthesis C-methylase UbiE
MLEKAKDIGASAVYIEADAHCLPFAAGCFDVVAFVTTVEFLAEPLKAIEEALRIASKQVIVGFLNRYSLTAMRRRIRGFFKRDLFSAARFYGVGELTRLIKAAGLNSGTRLEFLKPQASWLNIGRPRLGAFAVVSARLDNA